MRVNTGNNDQHRQTTSTRDNDLNIPEIIIVTVPMNSKLAIKNAEKYFYQPQSNVANNKYEIPESKTVFETNWEPIKKKL